MDSPESNTRTRALRNRLQRLVTTRLSGVPSAPAVLQTPSARGSDTNAHFYQEIAATVFRFKGLVPLTFFRDVKAFILSREGNHENTAESTHQEIRQFVDNFVYYFCTSAGQDALEPVPEDPMAEAMGKMMRVVEGNRTLTARLQGFVPHWHQARLSAWNTYTPQVFPTPRISIPPLLMKTLEKSLMEILGFKLEDRNGHGERHVVRDGLWLCTSDEGGDVMMGGF